MAELTHFDESGMARMVDVGGKDITERRAIAHAAVRMKPETFARITRKEIAKGDVLGVAQVAGIMAAKRTSELIPMCHPLPLTSVELSFQPDEVQHEIHILATVRTVARTGVEMEALTAAAAAGLTVYDMCKAIDKAMEVTDIYLVEKTGGKSGTFRRPEAGKGVQR